MKTFSFFLSFILMLFFTPAVISFSYKRKILDYPKDKSIHSKPMPMTGGLLLFIVFFAVNFFFGATNRLIPLFLGALPVVLSGLYDDLKGLSAGKKLLFQLISAMIMVFFGVTVSRINIPFIGIVGLGMFSIPITVLWFIFMMNLINVMDGLDGLAAGLCLLLGFVFMSFAFEGDLLAQLFVLCGSLLAFLTFNFYPARIFLGNNGSSFLGFIIAYFALASSQKSTVISILMIPCLILLVPILDIAFSVSRRVKNGAYIFSGDRGHLHHLLLRAIKDHRLTVLLFYLSSSVMATVVSYIVACGSYRKLF